MSTLDHVSMFIASLYLALLKNCDHSSKVVVVMMSHSLHQSLNHLQSLLHPFTSSSHHPRHFIHLTVIKGISFNNCLVVVYIKSFFTVDTISFFIVDAISFFIVDTISFYIVDTISFFIVDVINCRLSFVHLHSWQLSVPHLSAPHASTCGCVSSTV